MEVACSDWKYIRTIACDEEKCIVTIVNPKSIGHLNGDEYCFYIKKESPECYRRLKTFANSLSKK